MQYWKCKCGAQEFWGSGMMPAPCDKCDECGSGFGQSPDTHMEPVEHKFTSVQMVETDEGKKPLTRCEYCHKTQAQIDRMAERKAAKKEGK